jgi:protein involved in polysaccharide export with SLBB domain
VADNNFLVPVSYWLSVNAGSNIPGLDRPEVNLEYATIQRLDPNRLRTAIIPFHLAKALGGDPAENLPLLPGDIVRIYGPGEPGPAALESVAVSASFLGGLRRFAWRANTRVSDVIPSADWLRTEVTRWVRSTGTGPEKLDADQINLDYAVVRRVSKDALRTEFIAFNLGKALMGDEAENLRLQPGDQITVYGPQVNETEAVNSVALSAPYLEGARRYAWRPGFKLSDVIPSAEWLRTEVTRWVRRSGTGPEKLDADQMNLDYATIRRVNPGTMRTEFVSVDLGRGLRGDARHNLALLPGDQITLYAAGATAPEAVNSVTIDAPFLGGARRHAWLQDYRIKDLIPSQDWLREEVVRWVRRTGGAPSTGALTDHVNAEYAVVARVNPATLRTETIAFHLARALQGDEQHNLQLQPGDQISLYAARQPGAEAQNSITVNAPLLGGVQRHAWRPGYTVRDAIPSAQWLREQVARTVRATGGALGSAYASEEINLDYAVVRRLDAQNLRSELIAFNLGRALQGDPQENLALLPGDQITVYGPRDPLPETLNSVSLRGEAIGVERRFVWRPGFAIRDIVPSADWLVTRYNYWQREAGKELRNDLNWDYAQVLRRVPDTLQTQALNFSLGGAVLQGRAEDNLPLQPGDRIALFTTQQMPVPVAKRLRMVTLAGEVRVPGVYQAAPGETLGQLVQRAGGFTPQAYTFGTDFRRESTRSAQQQNLDRLVQRLELQAQSDAQARVQNVTSAEQQAVAQASLQADRMRLAALRSLRATGRIALRLDADKPAPLPDITLEDGDVVTVPERPSFVAAFGAVNNDNVVLWKPGMTVGELLGHAGPTAQAELEETHVLRADGTVLSADQASTSLFSRATDIRHTRLMPGDTVVVPEKADRETAYTRFIRGAKDITSILYQFGLGAAAIKTLRN